MSWKHCQDFICQHGKCLIKWGCGYFTGQQGEITEAARFYKKQDADSLMRPFHNMSMWQGQDVVHSLGLKIKTAPLDAQTSLNLWDTHCCRAVMFFLSYCSALAYWCFWDSSWWDWWWSKNTEDERNILENVADRAFTSENLVFRCNIDPSCDLNPSFIMIPSQKLTRLHNLPVTEKQHRTYCES